MDRGKEGKKRKNEAKRERGKQQDAGSCWLPNLCRARCKHHSILRNRFNYEYFNMRSNVQQKRLSPASLFLPLLATRAFEDKWDWN